jgi:hypothetical protein
VQNRRTLEVKHVISEAARKLGGVNGLVKWAKASPENLTTFWSSIYPKMLPLQVGVRAEFEHTYTAEVLEQKLREHNLPETLFGYDTGHKP